MDELRELMMENARLLRETILATREFQIVQAQYFREQHEQNMTVTTALGKLAEHDAVVDRQIESLVRAVEAFIRGQRHNGDTL